jgi:hypothetical protein
MSPQEMQELAELLQNVPGIHSIDLKDVKRLAQLLRETPEIGSIEVKGWFGTGVVISDMKGPTGGILLQTATGAMISINETGILISNGQGAVIKMTGPMTDINLAALQVT